ncbi:MAG: PIN domain-containing protein [Ruminiclostridium sp.]
MFYFIDYENIGANGFNGIDILDENDTVILFYSENNCRLPFSLHKKIGESKASFQYYDIRTGARNAADFQLVTYLGFIIATNPNSEYTIISKDDGFNAVVRFWADKGITVYRSTNLFRQSMPPKKVEPVEEVIPTVQEKTAEIAEETVAEAAIEEAAEAEQTEEEISAELPIEELTEEIAEHKEQPVENAEQPSRTSDIDITQLVEEIAKPAEQPAEQPSESKRPYKRTTAKKPRRQNGANSTTEQLKDLIPQYHYDIPQINEIIGKYKTKQGINNALVKLYGTDKTGVIYKAIKPLLKDKKGRD